MKWKVLIVDDDRNFRYAMREVIPWETNGFQIVGEAIHGKQALEILKEKEVHILLTDMDMPVMNGVELTEQVKKQYPDIMILALSAFDDFGFVKESMRLGAEDYILKQDFNGKEIVKILKELCQKYEAAHSKDLYISQIRGEIISYIKGENKTISDAAKSYRNVARRGHLTLFLVNSKEENAGIPDNWEGSLLMFAKTGASEWMLLYQLPDIRSLKEKAMQRDQMLQRIHKCFPEKIQLSSCDCDGDWEKLPQMYQRAACALQYKLYFPQKIFFHYLEMEVYEKQRNKNYHYPIPVEAAAEEEICTELYKMLFQWKPDEEHVNENILAVWKQCSDSDREKRSDISFYEELKEKKSVDEKMDYLKDCLKRSRKQKIYQGKHHEIRKAVEYISLYYAKDISLREIAGYAGLSENYFSNLFKQETGENLVAYINRVRIEQAKQLLDSSGLKVYEIAEAVGFRNATYLSTTFKKITGISISEYRNG